MRMVRTPVHGIVLIYEADPVAGENGQRTLVFESGKTVEQLSQFPQDWRRMSDDDLLALPLERH